ncbi:hypothetical protein [Nonomuraea rhizosphaerae]|uniref:hypothetical protein n=1 Tax=Nonomuraea rhizosphaerae TaxID=2665663 RepID=UPI001C5F2F6B|nr:hypothetical protein [Nonomuraea rhizosphaerae]
MITSTRVADPAAETAYELCRDLERVGISATVTSCNGIALTLIRDVGLNVWCQWGEPYGWYYRWATGRVTAAGYWEFAMCSCLAHDTALRRILARYEELRTMLGTPGRDVVCGGQQ